jgi:hypothetical protein
MTKVIDWLMQVEKETYTAPFRDSATDEEEEITIPAAREGLACQTALSCPDQHAASLGRRHESRRARLLPLMMRAGSLAASREQGGEPFSLRL